MTCNASTKAKRRSQAPKSNLTIAFLKKSTENLEEQKRVNPSGSEKYCCWDSLTIKGKLEDAKMKIDGIGVVNFKH